MRYLLILFIFASCATVRKSRTVETVDSVHVTVTDTSRHRVELTEYDNKTIEVYDTVRITKDSVITVLKYRTIWNTGKSNVSEKQNYIIKDSVRLVTKTITKQKTVDSTNKVVILLLVLTLIIFIIINTWIKLQSKG